MIGGSYSFEFPLFSVTHIFRRQSGFERLSWFRKNKWNEKFALYLWIIIFLDRQYELVLKWKKFEYPKNIFLLVVVINKQGYFRKKVLQHVWCCWYCELPWVTGFLSNIDPSTVVRCCWPWYYINVRIVSVWFLCVDLDGDEVCGG